MRWSSVPLVVVGFAVAMSACDRIDSWTVVNSTDEDVITRLVFEECDVGVHNKNDFAFEQVVAANATKYIEEIWGGWFGPDPGCVQVMRSDRTLVLAESYSQGQTYGLREPLPSIGPRQPEESELPDESWGEGVKETPKTYYSLWAVGLLLLLGFMAGMVDASIRLVKAGRRTVRRWRGSA